MRRWVGVTVAVVLWPAAAAAQDGWGGSRNNGLVRDQVGAGMVPLPEAFTVEGLMAEHHFPVRRERCEGEFCVLTAMGHGLHRPTLTRSAYLLVEPVSGIEPERHERAAQNLAIVIDRSGSMSGWKLSAAREAAHAIVRHLGPRDRLAIVSFDDTARLHRPSAPVTDRASIHRLIDGIAEGGSTNLEAGLRLGFQQVAAHAGRQRVGDRVFVLTDERPNVGETDSGGFQELVGTFAARRVGLSVIGVGLDLRAQLAGAMSRLPGGSHHYLEGPEGVPALFAQGFDAMVTPVAYQVQVTVQPAPGLRVADVYGVPGDDFVLRADGSATLRASTAFLDHRRSGAVLRLEATGPGDERVTSASATVTFRYLRASDGRPVTGSHRVQHRATEADSMAEFSDHNHYRAYAVVNFAQLLRAALRHWHLGRSVEALRIMSNARNALAIDARIVDDPHLAADRALAERILHAMHAQEPAAAHAGL